MYCTLHHAKCFATYLGGAVSEWTYLMMQVIITKYGVSLQRYLHMFTHYITATYMYVLYSEYLYICIVWFNIYICIKGLWKEHTTTLYSLLSLIAILSICSFSTVLDITCTLSTYATWYTITSQPISLANSTPTWECLSIQETDSTLPQRHSGCRPEFNPSHETRNTAQTISRVVFILPSPGVQPRVLFHKSAIYVTSCTNSWSA